MGTLIVHPKNKEQLSVLKAFMKALKISFEESKGNVDYDAGKLVGNSELQEPKVKYKKEFVDKINLSEEEFKTGKYKSIKTKDLWK